MNGLVLQVINLETIFSNILGGGIALLVAIWVSRREADRQARQQRENWYRKVHNRLPSQLREGVDDGIPDI